MEEEESNKFPSEYQIASYLMVLGLIMAFCMLVSSVIFGDDVTTVDRPMSQDNFLLIIADKHSEVQWFTAFDTFFIAGYTALFVSLFLLTTDVHPLLSKIALLFGLVTSFLDLLENALILTFAEGVPKGWEPHPVSIDFLWWIGFIVDMSSYLSAIIFATILLSFYPSRTSKNFLGLLLLFYALIGFFSIINSTFLMVRSLFFVIGLTFAILVVRREPEITLDELLQVIEKPESDNYA